MEVTINFLKEGGSCFFKKKKKERKKEKNGSTAPVGSNLHAGRVVNRALHDKMHSRF